MSSYLMSIQSKCRHRVVQHISLASENRLILTKGLSSSDCGV